MIVTWFHTVFGFRSYHQLRRTGPWRTVFFAVYLLLVGVLFFNLYFAWQLHKQLPDFVAHFPTITFDKGHLISPDTPLSITIPGTDYVIILDASVTNPPTHQEFIDKKIMAFVTAERFYMPSINGLNSQSIPEKADGTIDAHRLQPYVPSLRALLQTIAFVGSFFITGMFLIFSILLAAAVVFFWSGIKRNRLPAGLIWRWAIFLQGPALVLWMIQFVWQIPLFSFALFVLFNIYTQQIFNTLPHK